MDKTQINLRERAIEVARDLATEYNDAPTGREKLAELAYIRGVTDGVQACIETAAHLRQGVTRV